MRESSGRNILQALVVFLFKMRTGNYNQIISASLGTISEQEVSEYCKSVLNSFEKDVLPNKFGLIAAEVDRDFLLTQTSPVARRGCMDYEIISWRWSSTGRTFTIREARITHTSGVRTRAKRRSPSANRLQSVPRTGLQLR